MKAAALAPDAILLPVDFDAYRHYSRLFKAAVRAIAPAHRGSRHRRDLHRPDRRVAADEDTRRSAAMCAHSRSRSRTPCARRRGLSCSIGIAPQQAAREDRFGSRQAERAHDHRRRRRRSAASGRCRRAGSTASARNRQRGSRRSASGRSASSRRADAAFLVEHVRPFARTRGCTMPRTVATRAPSSRTASRSRSAARRPSSATCPRPEIASSCRRFSPSFAQVSATICSARATRAARSASSCGTTTSRR